jgi:hypothetical protein
VGLLRVGSSLTKSDQGRKILAGVGQLGEFAAKYVEAVPKLDKIIQEAVHVADFIWKCMADDNMIYQYYGEAGNDVLKNIDHGREIMMETQVGKETMNKESALTKKNDGSIVMDSRAFNIVRNAQGFERSEELSDFLKLGMVHSLLFSASKFNPLEEARILAECILTILGHKDDVGKTDTDTAVKVFHRLQQ